MLTRTAFYEGTIKTGFEDEFFHRVRKELEPLWIKFPHVTAVRVQRQTTADKDAPAIAMILEMDFPDMAAIEACLASSIRPEAHAATEEVMKLFDGRFYHIVSEARILPVVNDAKHKETSMTDYGPWKAFKEERTSGWTAEHQNGLQMEVWASFDAPDQFRVAVDKVLQPDFYGNRQEAFAAAEAIAAAEKPPSST